MEKEESPRFSEIRYGMESSIKDEDGLPPVWIKLKGVWVLPRRVPWNTTVGTKQIREDEFDAASA
jgi:hypothetical protein